MGMAIMKEGGKGKGEGDGTLRALGYLEFLTQDKADLDNAR